MSVDGLGSTPCLYGPTLRQRQVLAPVLRANLVSCVSVDGATVFEDEDDFDSRGWVDLRSLLSSASGVHTIEVISISLPLAPPPTMTFRQTAAPSGASSLTLSLTGCACFFDPTRFDCACCDAGACQCASESSKCVVCEPSQARLPPVESATYSYTYPKGAPPGWGGPDLWYDDPQLSILNDGDVPSVISTSNSIEWTSASYEHDYEPLLDLGEFRWVRSVSVSYIVALDWNKQARYCDCVGSHSLSLATRPGGKHCGVPELCGHERAREKRDHADRKPKLTSHRPRVRRRLTTFW